MKSRRILSFLLLGIFFLACEDEQQTWLSEMDGKISCGVPDVVGINQPVTFTVVGISTPGNVAYTWKAPDFSPTTFTGVSFEAVAPGIAGAYFISITAKSAGYRDVTYQQKVIVVPCAPMQGDLGIAAPADVVINETVSFIAMGITTPEENVTYLWTAPNFNPSSYTGGATFETRVPAAAGTYEMIVTAKAENYCDTSITKIIEVKPGRKMQGMLDFTVVTEEIIKNQEVTFAAKGISYPSAEYLSYTWDATGFTTGTGSGNSYTAICPPVAGAYTVTVTATATGFSDTTAKRIITVGDDWPMTGYVSISVSSSEVVISQPVTFTVFNHITNVPEEDISFVWEATNFNPSTYQSTGNTFTAIAPATQGSSTITVTARAAKYSGKQDTKIVTVKGGLDMTGTLDINAPDEIVKDLPAAFSVYSTLVTQDETPITYEWDAPGFTATTFGGPTFTGTPIAAGPHTIKLTAKANGYTSKETSKPVDVIDGLDMGTLTIVANGGTSPFPAGINTVSFTPEFTNLPASPVTYTWNAPGCTPNSFPGDSYNPTLPSEPGTYKVTLTARATGYNPKQATFDYAVTCSPMTVSFNLTHSKLLTNDETTLTVNPPAAPTSGVSYEWTVPTGFDITAGSSITPSVTVKTPATELVDPVPITLTAKAVNYCDASYSNTVTVKDCYNMPSPPTITANLGESNGFVIVPSRRNVTFSTPGITALRTGGTVTYKWEFMTSSLPFNPSSLIGNSNTFTTTAPEFNAETYTLDLRVTADGYCSHTPVTQKVVVAPHTDQLRGKIVIKEAIKSTDLSYGNQDSTIWLATDHATTLTAVYIPAAGENGLKLTFTWKWLENSSSITHHLNENSYNDTIGFSPLNSVDNWLVLEVADYNGKAPTSRAYPYIVQDCHYTGTDLHVNINYQCGITSGGGNYTAFIKDATDNKVYRVAQIQNRWWFTENLRRNEGQPQILPLGYFYPKDVSILTNICPAGWRIPNGTDWTNLATITSSNQDQFKQLIINNTSSGPTYDGSAWAEYMNTPGENKYDFSAIPTGYLIGSTAYAKGTHAYFLTNSNLVYLLGDPSNSPPPTVNGVLSSTGVSSGNAYYNIRCVRNYP
jgi:uncharacterized protein (TIGR02145 family)